MELQELLGISPSSYLQEGFLAKDGTLRDGINGTYSLALAYQLREEGIDLDQFRNAVEQLKKEEAALQSLRNTITSLNSHSLQNLLQAAEPWLKDPAQNKAFISHLERILQQAALIIMLPAEENL
ncbi:hypothetical protein L0222_32725 [bacterium]|nr:hypothetical protein [bacterium]MCI0603475.1 hypothetical protein [bacterium]